MADVSTQDKKSMTEALKKFVAFGQKPNDKQSWDAARIALGELGSVTSRLLVGKPQEDIALSSSLTELDGFAEGLYRSPKDDEARRRFEVSLGDVEYRINRLFGVNVRQGRGK